MALSPVPTILLARPAISDRHEFVAALRREGYLVLICHNDAEAMDVARLHSRPIQVMVTGEDGNSRSLAAKLMLYRPQMRIVYVNDGLTGNDHDVSAPDMLVEEIRELLNLGSKHLMRRAGAS